ncbi:hypothetical protein C8F04DRAFT_1191392 [Mycena alexandri]|uniref:Uncharacterized protein n=1 Tax=Mycena alexandri TaxID=1745969 RepID=A0AAD6SDA1_9AGAR|nr:hypothetical protein C8F04DRAFT_1191392 [Mycena alexandri]
MSSSRFSVDSSSIYTPFTAPRPAPRPQGPRHPGTYPSPPPETLFLPTIPPADCPLHLSEDDHGNILLPRVSHRSVGADHDHAIQLCRTQLEGNPKCSNCMEMEIDCQFWEAGIPCPSCAILGIPDCSNASPQRFIDTLVYCRDQHFYKERQILSALVRDDMMTPAKFEREYAETAKSYYAVIQGALSRFAINSAATAGLAQQGYQDLAASSNDASLLSRFLTLGTEAHIHPSILRAVSARLQSLFNSFL